MHSSVKVHPDPSDLFTAAADADEQATLDLLNQTEGIDLDPWWRVAPVNYLLDEPSITAPIDNVLTQTKADIAMEFSRLVGLKPHHKQR